MSDRNDKDIEIKDLAPEENLTPEEKERLAGTGRFRPTLEVLEAREMMDAGLGGAIMAPVPQPGRGAAPDVGHVPRPGKPHNPRGLVLVPTCGGDTYRLL